MLGIDENEQSGFLVVRACLKGNGYGEAENCLLAYTVEADLVGDAARCRGKRGCKAPDMARFRLPLHAAEGVLDQGFRSYCCADLPRVGRSYGPVMYVSFLRSID